MEHAKGLIVGDFPAADFSGQLHKTLHPGRACFPCFRQAVKLADHHPGLTAQQFPGFGDIDAFAQAFKKLATVVVFQFLNHLAHRRLSDIQLFRCPGHGAGFGHGNHNF